jgi:hypothetical protein
MAEKGNCFGNGESSRLGFEYGKQSVTLLYSLGVVT